MSPQRHEQLRATLRRAGIDEAALTDEQLEVVMQRMVEQAAAANRAESAADATTDDQER